jgi:DNA-binding Lrp family transcriptional regulator
MSVKTRVDMWIAYEENKAKVMEVLHVTHMTRNELADVVGLTKMQIHNIIKNLHSYGFIKAVEEKGVVCSVSGRTMRRYMPTKKKFVARDMTGMKERSEANRIAREKRVPRVRKKYDMTLRNSQIKKEEMYEKADNTIIKVNEHTTIYLNSKRNPKDYSWQRKRKHSEVSIGSGMNMFGNW